MRPCLLVILFISLTTMPVRAENGHWHISSEPIAYEWDEEEQEWIPVVPGPSIMVTAPLDDDDEVIAPAEAYEWNGKHYWGTPGGWMSKESHEDRTAWANEPAPTLSLTVPGEVLAGAFITRQTTIQVSAEGGVGEITWEGIGKSPTAGTLSFNGSGNTRSLIFSPDQAADARNENLKYQIIVRADPELEEDQDITQDVQSRLRQQYWDRGIQIPPRGSKWISSSALKVINQQEIKDNFAKLQEKYTSWVRSTKNDNTLDADINVHSSARTPFENARIDGAKLKSLHQYGYAYDLTPLYDLGGVAGKSDDADKLVSIWQDTLGFKGAKGYTYRTSNGNKVHIQIHKYPKIVTLMPN